MYLWADKLLKSNKSKNQKFNLNIYMPYLQWLVSVSVQAKNMFYTEWLV